MHSWSKVATKKKAPTRFLEIRYKVYLCLMEDRPKSYRFPENLSNLWFLLRFLNEPELETYLGLVPVFWKCCRRLYHRNKPDSCCICKIYGILFDNVFPFLAKIKDGFRIRSPLKKKSVRRRVRKTSKKKILLYQTAFEGRLLGLKALRTLIPFLTIYLREQYILSSLLHTKIN